MDIRETLGIPSGTFLSGNAAPIVDIAVASLTQKGPPFPKTIFKGWGAKQ